MLFVRAPLFVCCIGLLIYLYIFVEEAYFFCLFYFSFYKALKTNFINFNSPYCFTTIRSNPDKRDFLTWLDVYENICIIGYVSFGTQTINRLKLKIHNRHFKFLLSGMFKDE